LRGEENQEGSVQNKSFWQTTKAFSQPLLIAIQFLSSLPVGKMPMPEERQLGESLTWYPVVGALLGGILCLAAMVLSTVFSAQLSAALLLGIWVILTGALHLDGFADCADAWMGGLGSKKRTLELMKDPTSGPIAVVALIILLLLKFSALEALFEYELYSILFWPLIFSRISAMFLFMNTPYARKTGLGSAISQHLSVNHVWLISSVFTLVACFALKWVLVPVLMMVGLLHWGLRRMMMSRIDGCTGDTAGALIELSEVFVLIALLASLGSL